MAVRPKFYLRNKPTKDGKYQVILKFSFNTHRLEYYCGISIKLEEYNPEYWKGKKDPIKSSATNADNFNYTLECIEADVLKLVSEIRGEDLDQNYIREKLDQIYRPHLTTKKLEKNSPSFISFFENALADSKSGTRVVKNGATNFIGNRYSTGSIGSMGGALSAIKRFMKHSKTKDLNFENINIDFYNAFRHYCFNVELKEKSTFGKYIKHINTLMREAGMGELVRGFKKTHGEKDSIYLTDERIQIISDLDLSTNESYIDKNDKRIAYSTLEKVRDLFLVGCYTGLRFSDFSKLNSSAFHEGFIRIKQIKTDERVTIPLNPKVKTILEKYGNEMPIITNQKFNEYIKHVAELAGLTETHTIKNTKGNKKNKLDVPLYSLVTSHCCRRSFATNMFKAGVSPMLIMSATGHKTEASFLKYIRATNEDKAKLLAEELKKLGLNQ